MPKRFLKPTLIVAAVAAAALAGWLAWRNQADSSARAPAIADKAAIGTRDFVEDARFDITTSSELAGPHVDKALQALQIKGYRPTFDIGQMSSRLVIFEQASRRAALLIMPASNLFLPDSVKPGDDFGAETSQLILVSFLADREGWRVARAGALISTLRPYGSRPFEDLIRLGPDRIGVRLGIFYGEANAVYELYGFDGVKPVLLLSDNVGTAVDGECQGFNAMDASERARDRKAEFAPAAWSPPEHFCQVDARIEALDVLVEEHYVLRVKRRGLRLDSAFGAEEAERVEHLAMRGGRYVVVTGEPYAAARAVDFDKMVIDWPTTKGPDGTRVNLQLDLTKPRRSESNRR